MLGAAGLTVWSVLSAQAALNDARDRVDALRDGPDIEGFDELRLELDHVDDAAGRADARLHDPWVRPFTVLPVLGRQVRSATALAETTNDAVDAVQVVVDAADRSRHVVDDPAVRPDVLRDLAEDAEHAAAVLAATDLGPRDGLIGSLRSARIDLAEEVNGAADAMTDLSLVARGIADLIDEPGRYLVLAGNNAQMQNGTGMFLNAGEMVTGGGDLHLDDMDPTEGLPFPPTQVPLEPDLAERWGIYDPNTDFRHLGLSPRFPVTASTADAIWTAMGSNEIDGVVSVDVVALEALLEVVGPVSTPNGTVDADSVRSLLLHDQYADLGDTVTEEEQLERRSRQSEIAEAAFNRLSAALDEIEVHGVRELADAVRGRHLLIWSEDPTQQARWEALDAAGSLTERSMLLSLINRSGVKLDWYVSMEASLEVRGDGPRRDVTVRVDIRNRAPSDGEAVYIIGPYPGSGVSAGTYLGILTLTLPADAAAGMVEGDEALAVVGSEGPANRVVGARVEVPPGSTISRTFHFTVGAGPVVVEPSGRADPNQWTFGEREFYDGRPHTVEV